MAQLSVNSLELGYEKKIVCKDVTFALNAGDYLSVIGENGAGKSTLIKALLGLKAPLNGSVVFGDGLKNTDIGYLPQHNSVQKDFPATVTEIVRSGRMNGKGFKLFYSAADKRIAIECMEKLGIEGLQKESFRELSGGQQQRVLLARALCAASKMLILDEPVAGLDPHAAKEMYSFIERLNKDGGITMIIVSHDLTAAEKYSSHILHLGEGKPFFGTKEEYFLTEQGKRFSCGGGL